jgi:hypothetical protein
VIRRVSIIFAHPQPFWIRPLRPCTTPPLPPIATHS